MVDGFLNGILSLDGSEWSLLVWGLAALAGIGLVVVGVGALVAAVKMMYAMVTGTPVVE